MFFCRFNFFFKFIFVRKNCLKSDDVNFFRGILVGFCLVIFKGLLKFKWGFDVKLVVFKGFFFDRNVLGVVVDIFVVVYVVIVVDVVDVVVVVDDVDVIFINFDVEFSFDGIFFVLCVLIW